MAAQFLARAVVITGLLTEVSLGLETETEQWGETHQRDTVVVLPSSSGDQAYNLADLPLNKEWGLVEINSDTDLTQAEFSRWDVSRLSNKSPQFTQFIYLVGLTRNLLSQRFRQSLALRLALRLRQICSKPPLRIPGLVRALQLPP